MRLVFNYIKKQKKVLWAAVILATINQGFSLVGPQLFRILTDQYALKAAELSAGEFYSGIALILGLGVATALISRIAKTWQDFKVSTLAQKTGAYLYETGLAHSFKLAYEQFENTSSGKLLETLRKARTDVQNFIQNMINSVFTFVIGLLVVVVYSFTVHWSLGLGFLFLLPIIGISTTVLAKKIRPAQEKVVKKLTNLSGGTTESLRNVELVKSLGLENQEIQRLNQTNQEIVGLEIYKIKLFRRLVFTQGTLVNLSRVMIEGLSLVLIYKGLITFGEFFNILFYSFFIFQPLYELGKIIGNWQEAKASHQAVEDILAVPVGKDTLGDIKISKLNSIVFQDVVFSYGKAAKTSTQKVNFTLHAGETVAFVGPSGAGKSTIIKLLAGLYQPTSGRIVIDGFDSKQIDYSYFRQQIGYVSQESQLFSGTLRKNLQFVAPNATNEEMLTVMQQAQGQHVLERDPLGLDAIIGEGGLKLSGGEKQRLAIARALLRKPKLLIFDEATSSLDSMTEHAITETIKDISKKTDSIKILIAHRLFTIAHVDRIFVLEKGIIIEQGTHEQLLKADGLYKALWRSQRAEA